MSDLPPPPDLPLASFTGGIRTRPLAWGATWPLGHLELTRDRIRIWGLDRVVDARRAEVTGVRFRPLALSDRISVVFANGHESRVYFATMSGRAVEAALRARGWPVIKGR